MIPQVGLRNIYKSDEESEEWQQAVEAFPNQVPRFENKTACVEFMRRHSYKGTNPDFPYLTQSVSTLISWEQIEKYLLPKLREFDSLTPVGPEDVILDSNIYMENEPVDHESDTDGCGAILAYVRGRMNLSIHRTLTTYSTINTLKYLYYHMRCGILVSIRQNELVLFCPFVNKDYENSWANSLGIEGDSLDSYYTAKSQFYREENILDMKQWWANGNIIDNEHTKPGDMHTQWWGDHFLLQLKDMVAETCNNREVPDCDFFLNKRDYPQLKYNVDRQAVTEPYGFIFDRDDRIPDEDVPLVRQKYESYAPILSFYSSKRFADIPIPPSEDWEAATGEIFPPTFAWNPDSRSEPSIRELFTSENLKKFDKPWNEKIDVAFFRGSSTGGGVTPETNQRLKVAELGYLWSQETSPYQGYLDAGVVKWNLRDKKIAGQKMTFLRPSELMFKLAPFTPIYEQSTYKYLLYIEGHCAACRYGFMMCLGSVILKVESRCVADEMWYFPLLRPFHDHVPVKADFSDLAEKIEWCRANDAQCQQIAQNAKRLYDKYISRDDYLQMVFIEISKRRIVPKDCFSAPPLDLPIPVDADMRQRPSCCEVNGFPGVCSTCAVRVRVNDSKRKAEVLSQHVDLQKRSARDRMRKRALGAKAKKEE